MCIRDRERSYSRGIYSALVDCTRIEVAHLTLDQRAQWAPRRGSLAEQAKPGKVAIEDFHIDAPIRAIRWNGVLLHPLAVNVAEKVVLRLD